MICAALFWLGLRDTISHQWLSTWLWNVANALKLPQSWLPQSWAEPLTWGFSLISSHDNTNNSHVPVAADGLPLAFPGRKSWAVQWSVWGAQTSHLWWLVCPSRPSNGPSPPPNHHSLPLPQASVGQSQPPWWTPQDRSGWRRGRKMCSTQHRYVFVQQRCKSSAAVTELYLFCSKSWLSTYHNYISTMQLLCNRIDYVSFQKKYWVLLKMSLLVQVMAWCCQATRYTQPQVTKIYDTIYGTMGATMI